MKKSTKWILGTALLLGAAHYSEWQRYGKQVAIDAGIPPVKALPKCMLLGILWWKPLRKRLNQLKR